MIALKRWLAPVRIAAYLFIAEGAVTVATAVSALPHLLQPEAALSDRVVIAQMVLYIVVGLLYVCVGLGILWGRKVWRSIGAIVIGIALGAGLANVVIVYWPLGSHEWGYALLGTLLGLALLGFQLWAVTNVEARTYCCR